MVLRVWVNTRDWMRHFERFGPRGSAAACLDVQIPKGHRYNLDVLQSFIWAHHYEEDVANNSLC